MAEPRRTSRAARPRAVRRRRAALLGPSLSVPFVGKSLTLGTWQQVIYIDFDNKPRGRELVVQMIGERIVAEVAELRQRPGLTADHPSMRAVGYRQFWKYLDGDYDLVEARDRALFATRQLAKRQITWLRSEEDIFIVNPLEAGAFDAITAFLTQSLC